MVIEVVSGAVYPIYRVVVRSGLLSPTNNQVSYLVRCGIRGDGGGRDRRRGALWRALCAYSNRRRCRNVGQERGVDWARAEIPGEGKGLKRP